MSFKNVVVQINDEIAEGDYEISSFQSYRSKVRNRQVANYSFLNYNSGFVEDDNYSFHIGGSDEFQFNISDEGDFQGSKIFRYGIAFSLAPSRSIPDPVNSRWSDIQKFNKFVKNNKDYFKDFKIWIFNDSGQRTEAFDVRKIKDSEIKRGNFIFIGKWLNKNSNEIISTDIKLFIDAFEYLLPLYKHIQFDEPFSTDRRYARLTWNTNKWHYPSYHEWTEENYNQPNKLHEERHGYGGEEWLFNPRYKHKGYQYGFVQGVNMMKQEQAFIKELTLFTIDPENKERYIVAEIKDVEVISGSKKIEAEISPLFQNWKNTMIEELKDIGADYKFFKKEGLLPNIRFENKDAFIYEDPKVANFLKNQKFTRFTAYKVDSHIELINAEREDDREDEFNPGEGRTSKGHKRKTKASSTDVVKNHSKITDFLRDYLIQEWKLSLKKDLSIEKTRLDGGLIDAFVKINETYITFEVKTRNTAKGNIRESLGQLFEYSFYKSKWEITKMIIVGPAEPNKKDLKYLKKLNDEIKTPIEYWSFNFDDVKLKNKFKIYKHK
tara:strand:- start:166224 stop:167873 length:1650 start_codon:yes stop_codon:yes gene_type:complete